MTIKENTIDNRQLTFDNQRPTIEQSTIEQSTIDNQQSNNFISTNQPNFSLSFLFSPISYFLSLFYFSLFLSFVFLSFLWISFMRRDHDFGMSSTLLCSRNSHISHILTHALLIFQTSMCSSHAHLSLFTLGVHKSFSTYELCYSHLSFTFTILDFFINGRASELLTTTSTIGYAFHKQLDCLEPGFSLLTPQFHYCIGLADAFFYSANEMNQLHLICNLRNINCPFTSTNQSYN